MVVANRRIGVQLPVRVEIRIRVVVLREDELSQPDPPAVAGVVFDGLFEASHPAHTSPQLRYDLIGRQTLRLELNAIGMKSATVHIEDHEVAAFGPRLRVVIEKMK